jgi:hypothetical protein
MTMQEHNEEVRFQIGEVTLAGTLGRPERALGIALFAHGSGSSGTARATDSSPRRCARPDSARHFLPCSPETKRPKI